MQLTGQPTYPAGFICKTAIKTVCVSVAMEALKKWDSGCMPRGGIWGGGLPSPVMGVRGCHLWKIFENTGANLCNLVHFW